jgi:hypothetical protein
LDGTFIDDPSLRSVLVLVHRAFEAAITRHLAATTGCMHNSKETKRPIPLSGSIETNPFLDAYNPCMQLRRLAPTVTVADNQQHLQMCSILDTGSFAHAFVCQT